MLSTNPITQRFIKSIDNFIRNFIRSTPADKLVCQPDTSRNRSCDLRRDIVVILKAMIYDFQKCLKIRIKFLIKKK